MRFETRWGAAVAYVVVMVALVYGLWDSPASANEGLAVTVAAGLAILHFATGWVIASWWAVALPVLAVPLAVPAGRPDGVGGEPIPIWLVLAYLVTPVGIVLVTLGVLAHRWPDRPAARAHTPD